MPTTTTKTIGSTGDYTTLQAWEDACPANLVTADEIWRGEMQNQEFVVSGNILTIAGQTTDSTRYVELTTASGASFADNANKLTNALRYNASNGAAMRSNGSGAVALSITTAYTRLSKFQFKDGNTTPTNAILINAGNCTLTQIIAESVNNGDSTIRVSSGTGHVFSNVLSVNYGTSTSDHGFVNVGGTVTYYNCTAIKPSNIGAVASGFVGVYATSTIKNCVALGFSKFYDFFVASVSGNNNAADTTISFGTSNQASLTYADQIEQPNSATGLDCRTKAGAALIANGADLSASGVTTDIVGTARSAPYDISAWQYTATVASTWTSSSVWL